MYAVRVTSAQQLAPTATLEKAVAKHFTLYFVVCSISIVEYMYLSAILWCELHLKLARAVSHKVSSAVLLMR
jgi:hypothetical protein